MDEIAKLKNSILIYSLIIALAAELISLPILGWNVKFLYGLALGTVISILAFGILVWTAKKTLEQGKKGLSFLSYMIRLILYGAAFIASMMLSLPAGIASILGILTTKIALLIVYGIKPKFNKDRKVPEEVKKHYEERDKQREEHKTDRVRDKVRRELEYSELEDESGEKTSEKTSPKEKTSSKELKIKERTYKTHKKLK